MNLHRALCTKSIFPISLLGLTLLISHFTAPQTALAGDGAQLRMATVDVNRIMNELPEAKQRKKDLEELSANARRKLEGEKKSLEAMDKKIKEQNLPADSDDVSKFKKTQRDYENTANDAEEEIKRQFLKINKTLTDKVLQSVERYAKENQIDLVIDRGARGNSPVLYSGASVDITDGVIKSLK